MAGAENWGRPCQRPLSRGAARRHPGLVQCLLPARMPPESTIDSDLATSQVKHPNYTRIVTVAKAELGTKRLCANCGAKFYDLNKDPIHCPKCDAVYEVAVARTRPEPPAAVAPRAPATIPAAEETPVPEPQEVETVSLEEADAEAQGAKKPAAAGEPEVEEEEVEMDESLDDSTFIEEQEEEDADVTDIIGCDIENEEEG